MARLIDGQIIGRAGNNLEALPTKPNWPIPPIRTFRLSGLDRSLRQSETNGMRDSLLYPKRRTAVLVGIAFAGILVFAIGSLTILCPRKPWSAGPITITDVRLAGVRPTEAVHGMVYWMDASEGTIRAAGEFRLSDQEGHMEIRLQPGVLGGNALVDATYWSANPGSFEPHFRFLFNPDLQSRLKAVSADILESPAVKERFDKITGRLFELLAEQAKVELEKLRHDPSLKQDAAEILLEVITRELLERRLRPRGGPEAAENNETTLTSKVADAMRGRVMARLKDYDWATPLSTLLSDPRLKVDFEDLARQAEPEIRKAIEQILWLPSDQNVAARNGRPNARLIWVTRRTLFLSSVPAILLEPAPTGQKLVTGGTLQLREAP